MANGHKSYVSAVNKNATIKLWICGDYGVFPAKMIMSKPALKVDDHRHSIPNSQSQWLELVLRQVATLRYGVVQIIVHDGQVTQIERTERVRLERPTST